MHRHAGKVCATTYSLAAAVAADLSGFNQMKIAHSLDCRIPLDDSMNVHWISMALIDCNRL